MGKYDKRKISVRSKMVYSGEGFLIYTVQAIYYGRKRTNSGKFHSCKHIKQEMNPIT